MDYFRSYSLASDAGAVAAWDSQVARAAELPPLAALIASRGADFFPEFARRYEEIRTLSRSARRALQRRLARTAPEGLTPEWRRKLAYSLAGAALLLALSQPAQATVFNVTTTDPGVHTDGKCSLIEAVINANTQSTVNSDCPAGSAPDTIVLPKGTFALTGNYSNNQGGNALVNITSDITIQGASAKATKITRGKGAPSMRFAYIEAGGALTLENVTISGFVADGYAGGVLLNIGGSVVIENSVITGNKADVAGGVASGNGIASIGYAKISGSILSSNTATGRGGALYNGRGTMVIENSTISGNTAADLAGAINSNGGHVQLHGTTVSNNTAGNATGGRGGAIGSEQNDEFIIVSNSVISGNKAYFGGAIYSRESTLAIDTSTITSNTGLVAAGGIAAVYTTVNIADSSITGNKVSASLGQGGGIDSYDSTLEVYGSTIAKNSAGYGGGVENFGGGSFNLTNSTITGNRASVRGGGVDNDGTFTFSANSTITGNKAPVGPNIFP